MRNAEATKNIIISTSADLFNTQGYKATSISDITKATGFTKGAIYRHFESKQDLESHALRKLSSTMFDEIGEAIRRAPDFEAKYEAVFSYFEEYMESPTHKGGCPLMNAAVEADDANPLLREQANTILKMLRASFVRLIENGIKNRQVKMDTDAVFYSTIFIASLEGGIMMSKLEGNKEAISHTISYLRNVLKEIME